MTTTVSAVVPVYSGAAHLELLATEFENLRNDWMHRYGQHLTLEEVIFVDDASVDGSSTVLQRLEAEHPWIHVVTLGRNYGQHPATMAGILHASGDWVATLDEDLQHRPAHIESLLRRAVTEQADVVYAAPTGDVHGAWHRDAVSRLFKGMLARLAGDPVIARFNSFRLCRGGVARAAASVSGHETYLDVALTWFTIRFAFEPVTMNDQRFQTSGRSGYTVRKLFSHGRRLLVSSHAKAVRFVAVLGTLAVALSVSLAARAVFLRLTDARLEDVPGWTSLFVSILFFGGITVFMLVVISEYLVNIVLHSQGKPTFFVVDRSGDAALADILRPARAAAEGG